MEAKEITVIDWIDYDDAENKKCSVGGMGGWVKGDDWNEYLRLMEPEKHPYLNALYNSIVEKGLKYNGADHQQESDGVPLFSDGTVGMFSYRSWGDLMAAIWNTEEKTSEYQYMDFYC